MSENELNKVLVAENEYLFHGLTVTFGTFFFVFLVKHQKFRKTFFLHQEEKVAFEYNYIFEKFRACQSERERENRKWNKLIFLSL